MLYPENNEKEPDETLFKNPPAEYRGIPFWSWNCRITRELIDWQLDCFREMGFGGVDIHPRSGLDTEYLGREFMELVNYTAEQCEKKGLICWLYDEDRFPSGAAGGKVTKNRNYRGRFLLLTKSHPTQEGKEAEPLLGFCKGKEEFDKAVLEGETPRGYYLTAYSLELVQGCLNGFRRLNTKEEVKSALKKGENVRFAYVKLMEEERWFEDQTYVDTMNPEAVKSFIDITYEAYSRALGGKFGSTVPAVFTDEPRIGKHPQPAFAMTGEDITIPYTEYLAEQIEERCKMDALDMVPEFVWELPEGKKSRLRYLYREMAAECFVSSYMDQIGDWCRQKGIAFTGHVLGEDDLIAQTMMLGDCMRCYRKMELPGIDVLCDNREFITAKQAASVARQEGREGVVSELYGVTHWDCGFKTYKLQGDWQAALGVTVRVPHLSHMSLQGEAKRDWPASIFYQSPWYREFPFIEDYFARLNTALTRGKAIVRIGVIHPVESMWLYFGPNAQTKEKREELNSRFSELVKKLLYGTLDFDFISEALLPGQYREESGQALLQVGDMTYSAVIVPYCLTLRSTTLDVLERFKERGGKIIFLGDAPVLADASESDRGRRLAQKSIRLSSGIELQEALEEERDIEIRKPDGSRADNLFYQLREDGNARWLFLCHVDAKENRLSVQEEYLVRIKGCFQATCYDAVTGEIKKTEITGWENTTVFNWRCYACDSILLRLDEKNVVREGTENDGQREETAFPGKSCVYDTVLEFSEINSYKRQEPNVLLLDYARYQIENGPVSNREEILRIDNELRTQFGFLLREGRMKQPWATEETEARDITLYYEVLSETEADEISLGIEKPERCRIFWNGKETAGTVKGYYVDPAISVISLQDLKKGKNQLVIQMKFHQKTELENLYVLGDFDVELRGSRAVIVRKQNELSFGDITRQGMPFYTGNLEYCFRICLEQAGEYDIWIPHFAAPVLSVMTDGKKAGIVAYAPHSLFLGRLEKGNHEVTICLYGNRFNGFGTLHNANSEYTWYGNDSYRTRGDEWTDSYLVRPVGIFSNVLLKKRRDGQENPE